MFSVHRREGNFAILEANHLTREEADILADKLQARWPGYTYAVTELVYLRTTSYRPPPKPANAWRMFFQSALDRLEAHE